MNIVFRVDSSSKIGLGHLMRCLVLAKQYKQDNIIFATQELTGNVNHKIKECGYQHISLGDNKTQTLINLVANNAIDLLVFDHYDIDYQFEKTIKDKTGVEILSFDDTYERHYCDILLNHNIYAKDEDYQGLVPNFCELRCGEKYTLIRDEFKKIKVKNRQINKNNLTVFVAMGGADTANISLKILKTLTNFNNISVNLVTTSANLNIDTLLNFSKQNSKVNIYNDYPNIAQLMNNSDFAIITPSVISYEVMYLNLPFIAIKTADNQTYVQQYLQEKLYYSLDSFNLKKLTSIIEKIINK
jgi:UDP-2,4-diacetamido-2,4,6-trideoxy-beta-L-altropyranose hydrolase